ncbi:hypothetical protein AgCh_018001 [Apium graveolens]
MADSSHIPRSWRSLEIFVGCLEKVVSAKCTMEVARKQRKKKKTLQKWLWGGLGLSITIGASVVAYSFLQQTSNIEPSLTSILLNRN